MKSRYQVFGNLASFILLAFTFKKKNNLSAGTYIFLIFVLDAMTVIGFLKSFDLDKHFKVSLDCFQHYTFSLT